MAAQKRIEGEARRQAIMDVALELFARDGLHGTTTRAIAEAAGISEALLYRHFSGKEALFTAIQGECLRGGSDVAAALSALPRTTRSLATVVHYMAAQIAEGRLEPQRHRHIKRLMLCSLAGDGTFARGFSASNMDPWVGALVDMIRDVAASGDTSAPLPNPKAGIWFAHHLFAMIGAYRLLKPPVESYGLHGRALLEEAVRFALRGMGITAAAIARHYDPDEAERLIERIVHETGRSPHTVSPGDQECDSPPSSASRSSRAPRRSPSPKARSNAASRSPSKSTKRTRASSPKSRR